MTTDDDEDDDDAGDTSDNDFRHAFCNAAKNFERDDRREERSSSAHGRWPDRGPAPVTPGSWERASSRTRKRRERNGEDSDSEMEPQRRKRNEKRVPGDLKVPGFPKINQLEQYKTQIVERVVNASNRDDHRYVTRWVQAVFAPDVDYESLNKPGLGMNMIDKKLALCETLPHDLARRVNVKKREISQGSSQIMSGRQVLWFVLDYFRTNTGLGHIFTIQDISYQVVW
jgi:hypothetical protein